MDFESIIKEFAAILKVETPNWDDYATRVAVNIDDAYNADAVAMFARIIKEEVEPPRDKFEEINAIGNMIARLAREDKFDSILHFEERMFYELVDFIYADETEIVDLLMCGLCPMFGSDRLVIHVFVLSWHLTPNPPNQESPDTVAKFYKWFIENLEEEGDEYHLNKLVKYSKLSSLEAVKAHIEAVLSDTLGPKPAASGGSFEPPTAGSLEPPTAGLLEPPTAGSLE